MTDLHPLIRLDLELQHERGDAARAARERRRQLLERSPRARAELHSALRSPEPAATTDDWFLALSQVAALHLPDIDLDELLRFYLADTTFEDAIPLLAIDLDEVTADALRRAQNQT